MLWWQLVVQVTINSVNMMDWCAEHGTCTPEIFNRLFKIDNREQKKFLLAHRRSRRKVPYSADWMMEWRQSFSSLFCSLFCFWAYHRNLSLPCVLSHFHQHHQIGTGGKSCYANILGGNIRRREKMECTMASGAVRACTQ